jgi:hypothetical protein
MEGAGEPLRQMVGSGRVVVAPDAHDALVARLAVATGFEALYVGSLGLSASGYGVPDQSLLGINQLVDQLRLITSVVDVPVCIDLEDGGGNAVTTYRNVAHAEAAGAAAIQIEDHVPGKSYGKGGHGHVPSPGRGRIVRRHAGCADDQVRGGRHRRGPAAGRRQPGHVRRALTCGALPGRSSMAPTVAPGRHQPRA